MKLCIDLFCGLGKPQLFLGANSLVEKLVACWAKNPYHVGLSVFHFSPCPIAFKSWLVGQFKYARLSAGLARLRKVRVLPADAHNDARIFEWAPRIVYQLNARISLMKSISTAFCRSNRASFGTIAPICVGRNDSKMRAANPAVSSDGFGLLFTTNPSSARLAPEGAIQLIHSFCRKLSSTYGAE